MTTIAQFTIDTNEFPLGRVVERFPGSTLELERVVPTHDTVIPYCWLRYDGSEDVEAVLDELEDLDVSLIDRSDDEYLLRAQWDPQSSQGILEALTSTDVSLLSAAASSDGWQFEVRGDDHSAISAFLGKLEAASIVAELTSISVLAATPLATAELTDPQREALLLAMEHGYYDTPRRATLDDIAAELEITRQSLAARLRRGTRTLIERLNA